MASILKVRASIDLGNIEAQIKIKKHFTVWQIKVLVFQEIAIKPHRQALFLPGKSNELDVCCFVVALCTIVLCRYCY